MKPHLSFVLLVALSIARPVLMAQDQSGAPPSLDPRAQAKQPASTENQQSARAFYGRIIKAGDQCILREASSHTSYQLDDQDKAKQFEGKNVKVIATMDPDSNSLHVVDISRTKK